MNYEQKGAEEMDEFRKELITKQSALIIKQRNELNHANAEIIRLKRENEILRDRLRAERMIGAYACCMN